jgi:nucleoid-associated protein YgaU
MANRYQNSKTQKLKDGRVVYKSKIYPKIPLKDTDTYIVTQTGDRVDTLANQFYGDSSLYWIILAANNIHDAPFSFSDGTILRIPKDYLDIINQFKS